MTTEYLVEYARSGRSKCKTCGDNIKKKSIRCGVSKERNYRGNDIMMTSWYHMKCFQVPSSFDDFDDGFDDLTEDDQEKVTNHVDDPANQWTFKKSKKSSTPRKLKRSSNLTTAQQEAEDKLQRLVEYLGDNFTGKVMEQMLRTNNQKISGVKKEKAYRCADGIMFGRLPLCPKCGGGKLRNLGSRQLSCPGYRDDEDFHYCRFKFDENNPVISEDDENWVERGVWEYDNDEVEEEVKEFLEDDKAGSQDNRAVPPPPTPFSGEEADEEMVSIDEDEEIPQKRKKKKRKKSKKKKRKKIPKKQKYTSDEDLADDEEEMDDFVPPLEDFVPETPRRSTRLARQDRKVYTPRTGGNEEEVIFETPRVGKKRKRKNEDEEEYVPPVRKKRKLE